MNESPKAESAENKAESFKAGGKTDQPARDKISQSANADIESEPCDKDNREPRNWISFHKARKAETNRASTLIRDSGKPPKHPCDKTPPRSKETRRKARNIISILQHPSWTGIGAIAAVCGLVFLIPSYKPKENSPPTISTHSQETCVRENGDTGSCPNYQTVSQAWFWADDERWLFIGAANQLPEPPEYPKGSESDHCKSWEGWLRKNRRFYASGAGGTLILTARKDEEVTLLGIDSHVFRRSNLPEVITPVTCLHYAGGESGYIVSHDTRNGQTTLKDPDVSEPVRTLPPGHLSAQSQDITGTLFVEGQPESLYEGQLVFSFLINGNLRKITVGSRSNPLRWAITNRSLPEAYDYNQSKKVWTTQNPSTPDPSSDSDPKSAPEPCGDLSIQGSYEFDHPSWGLSTFVVCETSTPPGQGRAAVIDEKGRVRWSYQTEDSFFYSFKIANPASDATENIFVKYNPGRYDGVAIFRPTIEGMTTLKSYELGTSSEVAGGFYDAELLPADRNGNFRVKQRTNSCEPSCADGKIEHRIFVWNGSSYVPE